MSTWIVDSFMEQFEGKTVLELGAGPGLCGMLAANRAKTVVLTDYMEIVMDLIDKNIALKNPRPKQCELFAA